MGRHNDIQNAYKTLGSVSNFYDGMITYTAPLGKLVSRLVWNIDQEKNNRYLDLALSGVPRNFSGKLLEVPVGTGVLTMPVYQTIPNAEITCLDYSADMMEHARKRADDMNLKNITFVQGDVGHLPFEDESFDVVLSLNGFHAFPDKDAAYKEIYRVLKPGGLFSGCFYVQGRNARTDWFIKHIYTPKGFFTPPFETAKSLRERLSDMYEKAPVLTVESEACFRCRKAK